MRHFAIAIACVVAATVAAVAAKPEKTTVFTVSPAMHCASCEKKIKDNMRFERGVKSIETSVPDRTVTLRYDSTKTDTTRLIKGFARIGYKAHTVRKP